MYNEELKLRFINEKSESTSVPVAYLKRQFKHAAEMEEELNKDLCNWSVYEIIEGYKMLNITSLESLRVNNSIYSMYTQYCLQQNLVNDNQNHYLECTLDLLKTCINKSILDLKLVDRDILFMWLEELPNESDRMVLLFLFEIGKSKDFKDLVNLKTTDIDFENKTIKLFSGSVVNVSDKLLNIINKCTSEDTYYSITGKEKKKVPLIDYGYVLKSYPNTKPPKESTDFQRGRNIYIKCLRIFDYLGVSWLNPNAIVESGKLDIIKRRAEELKMTPVEYIYSSHIEEVNHQYSTNIVRSIYVKKYADYLN